MGNDGGAAHIGLVAITAEGVVTRGIAAAAGESGSRGTSVVVVITFESRCDLLALATLASARTEVRCRLDIRGRCRGTHLDDGRGLLASGIHGEFCSRWKSKRK